MFGRVVTVLAAFLLLFASLMKGLALADTSVNPGQITSDWWLPLGAAAFELILAAWLATGVFPATGRWVAVACFAGFAGFSLYKVIEGEKSCGCLGNFHVDPRYMLAFDVCLAAALWWVGPTRSPAGDRRSGWVLLAGVLVLTAGLAFKVYQEATSLPRGLVIDQPSHDFGESGQNQELTHVFALENRCPFAVEIVKTSITCSCTTISGVDGQEIPAGGQFEIPVSVSTKEHDEHIGGRITLYCRRVGSQGPPAFFQELTVATKVEPDYWLRPLVLDFGTVDHDRPVSRVIRLRPHKMPDVRITELKIGNPSFAARVLNDRSPEGDIQIEVTFCGRQLTGDQHVETPLTVRTSSRKRPEISAMARVYFHAPVSVEPTAVVVAADAPGEVVRELTVTAKHPIRLASARLTSPAGTVTTAEDSPTRWRVRITFPAETRRTGLNCDVRFSVHPLDTTGAGEARDVVVPVYRLPTPNP